jgi:AcrR family transcriptional regulator
MRYKPEHKEATRAKIVATAARLFRKHGYDGAGIDSIMGESSLTRGGFYGHFKSKSDLFAAVIGGAHDFIVRMRGRHGNTRKQLNREAREIVDGYLEPANLERIGRGCSFAALSADVARSERTVRNAYAEKFEELVAEFERGIENRPDSRERAIVAVATCVGAVLLARGARGNRISDDTLAACREAVHRRLNME